MSYYRRRSRSSYRRYDYGSERAREHIAAAKRLTEELGGADQSVKRWFFSLPNYELSRILGIYGNAYGASAREYAEKVIPQWKSGAVQMSGMVAERLFKLLPPFMPLTLKYEIIEGLWQHFGPTSRKTLYVGPDVDTSSLAAAVQQHIDNVVTAYRIPPHLETRFDWLSANDVGVKQDLLDHLRTMDKALAVEAARVQIPVLLERLRADTAGHIKRLAHIVTVGTHELELVADRNAVGVQETPASSSANSDLPKRSIPWWSWLVAAAILLWLFARN
jgi:hypothetical protein